MSERPTRKPAPSVVREINDSIRYAMWSVFASVQPLGEDRDKVAAEAAALLADVVERRRRGARGSMTSRVCGPTPTS